MKKIVTTLVLTIIIILNTLTVFAGDIPESFLSSDDAQIFFGEVLSYHPNKKDPSIEVAIVEVIKGNIKKGTKHTYIGVNTRGNFSIQNGKVYLFTYYDDANPTDVFEVTTYNTKTLKLKHVQGDMWKRFEKYLNQGKYGEAKIEGMLPYYVDIIYGALTLLIVIILCVIIVKFRKNKNNINKN